MSCFQPGTLIPQTGRRDFFSNPTLVGLVKCRNLYQSQVCCQEIWYILSDLDIRLEQSQNDIPACQKLVQGRDVVQPPGFVTVTLKRKLKKLALSTLSPGHVSARRSRRYITRRNTKFVLADYTKCTSHAPDLNMDSCFLPMQPPFFLAL